MRKVQSQQNLENEEVTTTPYNICRENNSKYEYSDYVNFIESYRVSGKDATIYTHTSLGNPFGKFNIPKQKYSQLFDIIDNVRFKSKIAIHLSERPISVKPLVVDFDFKFNLSITARQYTQWHLIETVKLYNNAIRQYLDIPENTPIVAYVFEKTKPTITNKCVKDGFHIIYPEIITHADNQHHIRSNVLEYIETVISTPTHLISFNNSINDVVDESVVSRNNWMIYGCCKMSGNPYKLTKIYTQFGDDKEKIIESPINLSNREMIELFSTHQDKPECTYNLRKELMMKVDKLDNLTSVSNCTPNPSHTIISASYRKGLNIENHLSEYDITEIRKLINILSVERADEYHSWIEVGWCLHSIDKSLLDIWIDFSKRSDKYVEGECEKLWHTMKYGNYTLGSLKYWAKHDNKEEYYNIYQDSINKLISKALLGTCTSGSIKPLVCQLIKDKVCSYFNGKNSTWYIYEFGFWNQASKSAIVNIIQENVGKVFLSMKNRFALLAINTDDPDEKERYTGKCNQIGIISNKIDDYGFTTKVVSNCEYPLLCPNILKDLDSDPFLFACKNGYFDLRTGNFHQHNPGNFFSNSCGRDFIPLEENDQHVLEVREFIYKIFAKYPGLSEYILNWIAVSLIGYNVHEELLIWHGKGRNGKSKLSSLIETTLGDYCGTLRVSHYFDKRSASGSNTELISLVKHRIVTSGEPDVEKNELPPLNTGFLKTITGNDTISGRDLFKGEDKYTCMFNPIICLNDLPDIPHDAFAVWERLRFIPFESSFKSNPKDVDEQQFKYLMDTGLKTKINTVEWQNAFLNILIWQLRKLIKLDNGYKYEVPSIVTEYTANKHHENDMVSNFWNENYIKDEENSYSYVKLDEVYKNYRNYCTLYQKKALKRTIFKDKLELLLETQIEPKKRIHKIEIRCHILGFKIIE